MSFIWLYLKINISDFWLILLDHTTYDLDLASPLRVGIDLDPGSSVARSNVVFIVNQKCDWVSQVMLYVLAVKFYFTLTLTKVLTLMKAW